MKTELQMIPGIGKKLEQHLIGAGYSTLASLKKQDPEAIYLKDCGVRGEAVDRCALYVYRLAVYYAEHDGNLPPNKQHWWDWQDQ